MTALVVPWSHILYGSLIGPLVGVVALVVLGERRPITLVTVVLNNSMKVLGRWAKGDPELAGWLRPEAARLVHDERKSVASNARKLLDQVGEEKQ